MICKKCGINNEAGAVFCAGCGNKLEKEKPKKNIALIIIVIVLAALLAASAAGGFLLYRDAEETKAALEKAEREIEDLKDELDEVKKEAPSISDDEKTVSPEAEVFPEDEPMEMSALDAIYKRGKLIVLTSPEFLPYEYFNENGELVGVDIEIAERVANALDVEVEFVAVAYDGILEAVRDGKGDMGISGITPTEEREEIVSFSTSYIYDENFVIVRDEPDMIFPGDICQGTVVGVEEGSMAEWLVWDTGAEVLTFDTAEDAINALLAGQVDAVVANKKVADAVMGQGCVVYTESFGVDESAAVVARENGELLEIVNTVIEDMIASGEMELLMEKHMQ